MYIYLRNISALLGTHIPDLFSDLKSSPLKCGEHITENFVSTYFFSLTRLIIFPIGFSTLHLLESDEYPTKNNIWRNAIPFQETVLNSFLRITHIVKELLSPKTGHRKRYLIILSVFIKLLFMTSYEREKINFHEKKV